MLEVEVKAPCADIKPRLLALGAKILRTESQEDTYFNSPWRDFRNTDEALRVRRVGKKYFLTYKGPKIGSEIKMREEIELPVGAKIFDVLGKLGFVEAAAVRKKRKIFSFENLLICLDCVEGLGDFIEIESKDAADKSRIFFLLKKLGIDKDACTRRSYLELLAERK